MPPQGYKAISIDEETWSMIKIIQAKTGLRVKEVVRRAVERMYEEVEKNGEMGNSDGQEQQA